jgi:hypothetical protein
MMKFFTAIMLGITFMFGFVNQSVTATDSTQQMDSDEKAFPSRSLTKNFDTFIIPGNICIVNTEGAARTFNSCAHECLNKKRSWFKISIGESATKR